ncbi:MAG TPA: sigma-70 family RNA polymerase sigma factor [Acidimicrobiales bacterium]|nr:sigma-70 family RNA polymerase sigma factor [Acidimicrobiales bacterium]
MAGRGHQRHGTGADHDESAVIARLAARSLAGDEAAHTEIVDRCTPLVRGIASRYVRNPADVDDVAQEVWLLFTKHLHRIDSLTSIRAWLARVTTHASWGAQRRATRAAPSCDLDDRASPDNTEDAAIRHAGESQISRVVHHVLGRLDPCDRRLIELLFAEEPPDYRTLAELIERPIGSIGPTRQRILVRLRRDPSLLELAGR